MATFRVTIPARKAITYDVEARDKETAIEEAGDRFYRDFHNEAPEQWKARKIPAAQMTRE